MTVFVQLFILLKCVTYNLKNEKYVSRISQKHCCKSARLPDSFSVAEALEERAGLQDLLGDQIARGLVHGRQVL
mgnify:CR=1 FL=1